MMMVMMMGMRTITTITTTTTGNIVTAFLIMSGMGVIWGSLARAPAGQAVAILGTNATATKLKPSRSSGRPKVKRGVPV